MLDMDIINAAMRNQNQSSEVVAQRRAANDANAKRTELNQEDFLTLMLTQLKHQDPSSRMDPAQQVGQLAQFSSVSGISEMNKQISSLTDSLRGNQVLGRRRAHRPRRDRHRQPGLSARSRRGRGPGSAGPGQCAQRRVVGAAGRQGFRRRAGEDPDADQHQGLQAFSWDGTTNAGTAAEAGGYKIEVIAKVGDKNVSLTTSVAARVSSVALDPTTGGLMLDTDSLGEIEMSSVERVL